MRVSDSDGVYDYLGLRDLGLEKVNAKQLVRDCYNCTGRLSGLPSVLRFAMEDCEVKGLGGPEAYELIRDMLDKQDNAIASSYLFPGFFEG